MVFRDHHYFALEDSKDLWQQQNIEEPQPIFDRIVTNTINLPRKRLNIARVVHDGMLLEGFHEVRAAEDLPVGTPVDIYVGRFVNERQFVAQGFADRFNTDVLVKTAYLLGSFNAHHDRNITAFINQGFPNITVALVQNIQGVANAMLFFVSEEIEAGSSLFADYGSEHAINFGPQMLFNRDAMEQFFRPGLDRIWSRIELAEDMKEHAFRTPRALGGALTFVNSPSITHFLLLKQRFFYPLQNPIALIHLHFKGIIDVNVWAEVMNWDDEPSSKAYADAIGKWVGENDIAIEHIRLISWLKKIDQNIRHNRPADYTLFKDWVLATLESTTVMDLTKGMDWIEEELFRDPRSISNENLPIAITNRLKEYIWTQDPTNLYSYPKRLAEVDRLYLSKAKNRIKEEPNLSPNSVSEQIYLNLAKLRVLEEDKAYEMDHTLDADSDEYVKMLSDLITATRGYLLTENIQI